MLRIYHLPGVGLLQLALQRVQSAKTLKAWCAGQAAHVVEACASCRREWGCRKV